MLITFFNILKIIGLVILYFILFVLALLVLVLIWPYKYKFISDNNNQLYFKFNLSFFFKTISIWVVYDKQNGFNIYAKLLGIRLYDKLKKDKKNNDNNVNHDDNDTDLFDDTDFVDSDFDDSETNDKDSDINLDNAEISINNLDEDTIEASDNLDDSDKYKNSYNEVENNSDDENINGIGNKTLKKKNIWYYCCLYFSKIEKFLYSIPDKINSIIERPKSFIEDISDKYVYYDKLLNSKCAGWVFEYLKKKIIKLYKAVKPYKSKIIIDYSSEEPDTSAKVYELYSVLSPYLPKGTRVNVYFDESEFKYEINVKGMFILGYIAVIVLTVILNKRVKKVIKLIKRD